MLVVTKGRKYSKVVINESDNSIENPNIKRKSESKPKAKSKNSNQTVETLETMTKMQQMKIKNNEATSYRKLKHTGN